MVHSLDYKFFAGLSVLLSSMKSARFTSDRDKIPLSTELQHRLERRGGCLLENRYLQHTPTPIFPVSPLAAPLILAKVVVTQLF